MLTAFLMTGTISFFVVTVVNLWKLLQISSGKPQGTKIPRAARKQAKRASRYAQEQAEREEIAKQYKHLSADDVRELQTLGVRF